MNNLDQTSLSESSPVTEQVKKRLQSRYRKEKQFQWMGRIAISFGFLMVAILILDIVIKAVPAFHQHWIQVDIEFNQEWLGIDNLNVEALQQADYRNLLRKSLYQMFPEVDGRREKRELANLLSNSAEFSLQTLLNQDPSLLGKKQPVWLLASADTDTYLKDNISNGKGAGRISNNQAKWLNKLEQNDKVTTRFNSAFFTNSDSREPEQAGIRGALTGTLLTMVVTLLISFPIGVAAALYLEEFAPQNRITDLIEVNINNLAAVPSIVFGLLGLAVIINLFGLPRSAPLVGGIVLSLMTLPTIIIASRASIKAVPPSIREAAIGLGASNMQVAFGHVLPLAMPGILTGTIIGLAQALGETAPLLMIGMVAFIVDVPHTITDSATVMPVQIFLWADSPERAFLAKTSAAILVLLGFLLLMNSIASLLRRKFEINW